jgi:hypothetical protein
MQQLIDKLELIDKEYFGCSVSISDSGKIYVIGARGGSPTDPVTPGSAYVFQNNTVQKLTAYDAKLGDRFGVCCRISGDGSTIAIGAYQAHVVYVFKKKDQFEFEYKLEADEYAKYFGYNLDINHTGDKIMVGAYNYDDCHGKAYYFESNILIDSFQSGETKARDFFGRSICFNDDATECYIGAIGANTVYRFKFNDIWIEAERIRGEPKSSFGNSISYKNRNLAIGGFNNNGYVLLNGKKIQGEGQYGGCVKIRHGRFIAGAFRNSDDWYGYSIDFFPDGSVLIGSPRYNGHGSAFIHNLKCKYV